MEVLNNFCRVALCTRIYGWIEDLPSDIGIRMYEHNEICSRRGGWRYGISLMATCLSSVDVARARLLPATKGPTDAMRPTIRRTGKEAKSIRVLNPGNGFCLDWSFSRRIRLAITLQGVSQP